MSLRMEEVAFPFEGKEYRLRCNMAVLEDVQELHNGSFEEVMSAPVSKTVLEFLTAMLNDYADEQGWPERWTEKQVKRRVTLATIGELDILGMVTRAVSPGAPEPEGN